MFPRPAFFQGAKLNFAENLLFPAVIAKEDEDGIAVMNAPKFTRKSVMWKELRGKVCLYQDAMRKAGLKVED